MALFETTLILLMIAVALLQVARKLTIPYPTMLAMAGVAVAAMPWNLSISIDPHLAMALFIAPALLDSAFDFPIQALKRHWAALIGLAAVAVVLTTGAVAWLAVAWTGMPLAAAIALGAIVSPPDAAAATAMLSRFSLPRATVAVLKGESLLNDATALMIYSAAVSVVSTHLPASQFTLQLLLAAPGGLLLGIVMGRLTASVAAQMVGTMGLVLFSFVATFATWIMGERLHVSATLAVVAYGMTLARYSPAQTPAADRVNLNAVWEVGVFVLNVIAFLLVGFQARDIVGRLEGAQLSHALAFAGGVFAMVVVVRIAWVLLGNLMSRPIYKRLKREHPTTAQSMVIAWCGMRGLVTLATALALPEDFPSRDLIVLAALAVVLGTLIFQGLTLGPLIRLLKFAEDRSLEEEMSAARVVLFDAVIEHLREEAFEEEERQHVATLRNIYRTKRSLAVDGMDPHEMAGMPLRLRAVEVQRAKLHEMRGRDAIDDDIFHELERELDLAELSVMPRVHLKLSES